MTRKGKLTTTPLLAFAPLSFVWLILFQFPVNIGPFLVWMAIGVGLGIRRVPFPREDI